MPTYYTYRDDVPLLPGQTLGFTPGRGYYAKGTPTPSQATRETTAAPSTVDRPTAPAAPPPPSPQPAPSYTDASSGGGYSPAPPQPQPAPTSPSNAAQVARQTAAAPASVDRPAGASAQPNTTPVNTATNFPSEHGQGGGTGASDTGKPPTPKETQGGYASPASTQPSPAREQPLHGMPDGLGVSSIPRPVVVGNRSPPTTPKAITAASAAKLYPLQPDTVGTPIPSADPVEAISLARNLQRVVPSAIFHEDRITLTAVGAVKRGEVEIQVKAQLAKPKEVLLSARAYITVGGLPQRMKDIASKPVTIYALPGEVIKVQVIAIYGGIDAGRTDVDPHEEEQAGPGGVAGLTHGLPNQGAPGEQSVGGGPDRYFAQTRLVAVDGIIPALVRVESTDG